MKKTLPDHQVIAIKALTNLVPGVGGFFASLIGDYVPLSRDRRVDEAIELFSEKLQALENRTDTQHINKDDFVELFEAYTRVVEKTQQQEKLHAAAALLANMALKPGDPGKVQYEELEHLMRCLDVLSSGAIAVLGACRQIVVASPLAPPGGFQFSALRPHFPDWDSSLLMGLVSELRGYNLLHVQEPPIRLDDYSNYLVTLTPIGRRFVDRFIEGGC